MVGAPATRLTAGAVRGMRRPTPHRPSYLGGMSLWLRRHAPCSFARHARSLAPSGHARPRVRGLLGLPRGLLAAVRVDAARRRSLHRRGRLSGLGVSPLGRRRPRRRGGTRSRRRRGKRRRRVRRPARRAGRSRPRAVAAPPRRRPTSVRTSSSSIRRCRRRPSSASSTSIYAQQDSAQFGAGRYAYFFKPGTYALDVKVGFYVQVARPRAVARRRRHHRRRARRRPTGSAATTRRATSGAAPRTSPSSPTQAHRLAAPTSGRSRRARTSGACTCRGDVRLDDGGWSSGGFIADSRHRRAAHLGLAAAVPHAQRRPELDGLELEHGVRRRRDGRPAASWPSPPYTTTAATPVVREKPFLYVDARGQLPRHGARR